MPPARDVVGVLTALFPPFTVVYRMYRMYRMWRKNSVGSIWKGNYNGFGPFGPENDGTFSWKFDFQGQIYLKVESTCFATLSNIWFWGPNLPKSWNTYFRKVDGISLDPPGDSKSSPRASKDLPRRSQQCPRGGPGPLQETNSIHSNSRSTAKRPLLVFVYMTVFHLTVASKNRKC